MIALSIRQPWAWLIVNGHKRLENRTWATRHRGPILIHAAKAMTRADYGGAAMLAEADGVTLPPFEALERGGIVGQAEIVDCINYSTSHWFFGPYAFVLENACPLPFRPVPGKLGFFLPKYHPHPRRTEDGAA